MIPQGFVSWQGMLRPEDGDAIVAVGADNALMRGVARELARLHGESLLGWRRDLPLPPPPGEGTWHRFPDLTPPSDVPLLAAFVDTIGWRALTVHGMSPRRFEPASLARCAYRGPGPFGVFVQRRPEPGFAAVDDVRRWAPYAWQPLG